MKRYREWTGEEADQLRRLWAEGFSCSAIAVKIGNFSRNAVIGKAHRLNLPGRNVDHRNGGRPPGPKKPRKRNALSSVSALPKRQPPKKISRWLLEPPPPPVSIMITLLDLTERTCKFPMGTTIGAAQLFCGAPKGPESSYCAYHYRLCWRPAQSKAARAPFQLPRAA